jgi:hypothetical protein
MPLFRVSLPVQLDIEVDATDALTARRLIDDAFKRVDPLNSPNVRVQVKSSLGQLARASVLDATAQGPAFIADASLVPNQ